MIRKKIELIIKSEEVKLNKMQLLIKTLPKGKLYTRKRKNVNNYSVYLHGKENGLQEIVT